MTLAVPSGARCDLHMHTNRSDGRFPVEEVLCRAATGGLDLVALTDHDLPQDGVVGEHEFAGHRLRVLAGIEVSVSLAGAEQHLLVYFPEDVPPEFRAFCRQQCSDRSDRWDQAVARIGLPGVPPADEAARRGERALTRHHLAQALVSAGHAGSVPEAFNRWLGDTLGLVPLVFPPMEEVIRRARATGGVPVWAHPPPTLADRHVPSLSKVGLGGLEGQRPSANAADRNRIRKLARRHGLVVTGGSDWHGWIEREKLGLWWMEGAALAPFFAALAA